MIGGQWSSFNLFSRYEPGMIRVELHLMFQLLPVSSAIRLYTYLNDSTGALSHRTFFTFFPITIVIINSQYSLVGIGIAGSESYVKHFDCSMLLQMIRRQQRVARSAVSSWTEVNRISVRSCPSGAVHAVRLPSCRDRRKRGLNHFIVDFRPGVGKYWNFAFASCYF